MTKPTNWLCAQRRLRSAWASAQSSLCAQWVAKDPSFLHADSKDWSDLADAQADLSLRWAQRSFCWFCHKAAQNASFSGLNMQYIYISSHLFTFRIEPNVKSFCHANNIVMRRDIHIHSLNWYYSYQNFLSCKWNMVCNNSAVVWLCKRRLRYSKCHFGQKGYKLSSTVNGALSCKCKGKRFLSWQKAQQCISRWCV